MPELPEVETVVLGLKPLIKGLVFESEKHDWPKGFPNSNSDVDSFLIGASVKDIKRTGKAIIIDLSSDYSVVIHLKMTGQLVYRDKQTDWGAGHPNDSLVGQLPDKSTRVEFTFAGGAKLFFNDQRKFGWVRLLPTPLVKEINFIKNLGPDALSVCAKHFVKEVSKRKKSIKACLLDQNIIAGCGNIYADECLWASQVHPKTLPGDLTEEQLKLIHKNLQKVLNKSIELGGSSNKNYVNARGEKGSYMEFANVYARAGKPCNRCGNEIERTVVATRGTHLCLVCQKEPA